MIEIKKSINNINLKDTIVLRILDSEDFLLKKLISNLSIEDQNKIYMLKKKYNINNNIDIFKTIYSELEKTIYSKNICINEYLKKTNLFFQL